MPYLMRHVKGEIEHFINHEAMISYQGRKSTATSKIFQRCFGERFLITSGRSHSPARATRQILEIGSESFTPTVHTLD